LSQICAECFFGRDIDKVLDVATFKFMKNREELEARAFLIKLTQAAYASSCWIAEAEVKSKSQAKLDNFLKL